MDIYNELGLKKIINASDTYTKIGGSRMDESVLAAMSEAGRYFVDIVELSKKVCTAIAKMTDNEAAFISSGAGACVVLTTASLITKGETELIKMLPDASRCERDEIIVFEHQTTLSMLPYWRLIELSGAKLVKVDPDIESLKNAITDRTAGIFYFLAHLYEAGLPPVEKVILAAHEKNIKVIIDAAAQLPPKLNLWYYTRDLGADGIIFSGGKFLMGPQSTGLFLGKDEIARHCYALSNPNVNIGRPYKVGKEEFAAIYTAVKNFVMADENEVKACQHKHLDYIEENLKGSNGITIKRVDQGRLEQDAPRLLIDFSNMKMGSDCAKFMYDHCDPAIDIGYYRQDDPSGSANQIFINSINLREHELSHIVCSIKRFLNL